MTKKLQMEKPNHPPVEHRGSLMTWAPDINRCLGHLMSFGVHGVYEPNVGRIDLDPPLSVKEVEAHNDALDQALIDGLDKSCKVGQGGSFYLRKRDGGKTVVETFTGVLVSDDVCKAGHSFTFRRNGRVFSGSRANKGDNLFHFSRID